MVFFSFSPDPGTIVRHYSTIEDSSFFTFLCCSLKGTCSAPLGVCLALEQHLVSSKHGSSGGFYLCVFLLSIHFSDHDKRSELIHVEEGGVCASWWSCDLLEGSNVYRITPFIKKFKNKDGVKRG